MTADHDHRDAAELASAYLDGEITDDERARVEADPALRAEVERLRVVRAAVGQVAPPPAETREAAIDAALAAFDAGRSGAAPRSAPVVPPGVASLEHRRLARRMQWLTAAAAAAVLVIGGFVIANRGGDDDDATVRNVPVSADEGEAEVAPAATQTPTTTTQTPTTTAPVPSTTASAALAPAETAAEFAIVAATDGEADLPLAAPAPAAATEADAASQDAEASAPSAVVIRDAVDLGDLGAGLPQEPPPLDDIVAACEDDPPTLVADATFVADDGRRHDVVVATTDDGYAAVSLDDCTVVLDTEP